MIPSQKFSNYTRSERDWFTERLSMHLSANTELHIPVVYNWKLGLTLTLSLRILLVCIFFPGYPLQMRNAWLLQTKKKKQQ